MDGRRPQNAASKKLAFLVSGTLLDPLFIQVVSTLPYWSRASYGVVVWSASGDTCDVHRPVIFEAADVPCS